MKITTLQGTLHTELFQEIMLHEQVGVITFSYGYVYEEDKGEGPTYIIQVPMTFRNARDCRKAFRLYLRGRNSGADQISFIGLRCRWPKDTYRKIIQHKSSRLMEL